MLLSNVFSQQAKEPKTKQLASTAMLFYGARVSSHPSEQIKAAIGAQNQKMTPAEAGLAMTQCARAMESSLKTLQSIAAQSK
jgi:hypothetical protein